MMLPDYTPPSPAGAWLAVLATPCLVLVASSLLHDGIIDSDLLLAVITGCMAWVVAELHAHLSAAQAYDEAYVRLHLSWRNPAAVAAMAAQAGTSPATRRFVASKVQVFDGRSDWLIDRR